MTEIGHMAGYTYKLQNGTVIFSIFDPFQKEKNIVWPFGSLYTYPVTWPISVTAVLGHFEVRLVFNNSTSLIMFDPFLSGI